MDKSGIVIAGVGGQGSLLTSRIIGEVAIKNGCDVKVSEVHGMSQRGGSVITYVKFDKTAVYSPIIDPGCADIVLSFELLEAYRCVSFLKKGGLMVVNTREVNPMPVITGAAKFPSDIIKKIEGLGIKTDAMDATLLAKQAGALVSVNIVMVGRLAKHFDFDKSIWTDTIKEIVKKDFVDINIKAFELGYGA